MIANTRVQEQLMQKALTHRDAPEGENGKMERTGEYYATVGRIKTDIKNLKREHCQYIKMKYIPILRDEEEPWRKFKLKCTRVLGKKEAHLFLEEFQMEFKVKPRDGLYLLTNKIEVPEQDFLWGSPWE